MRVATLNIRHRLPVVKMGADVRAVLAQTPDVAGLQECSGQDRRKALEALLPAWRAVNPEPHQTPIVVNTARQKILDSGTWHLNNRLPEPHKGAGTATAKWAVWVLVEDRATGAKAAVVNCHLVPSLWWPPRKRLHKRQQRRLAALVKQLVKRADAVTVLGDFNAPLSALGIVREQAPYASKPLATHGKRSIDHILSTAPVSGARVLDGLHTDHRALIADVTVKEEPMPDPTPGPYDRCTYHGKTMDERTKAALQVAESYLGYELTVVQGCYHPGVDQSAGTHDGGGVVDLAPYDQARKVRVLRDLGWAAWYRPTLPGKWGAHIHAVLIGHDTASSAAKAQVLEYKAGGDGLVGESADPNPYRPNPIPTFDYRRAMRDVRLRKRIKGLRARIRTLRDRISYRAPK